MNFLIKLINILRNFIKKEIPDPFYDKVAEELLMNKHKEVETENFDLEQKEKKYIKIADLCKEIAEKGEPPWAATNLNGSIDITLEELKKLGLVYQKYIPDSEIEKVVSFVGKNNFFDYKDLHGDSYIDISILDENVLCFGTGAVYPSPVKFNSVISSGSQITFSGNIPVLTVTGSSFFSSGIISTEMKLFDPFEKINDLFERTKNTFPEILNFSEEQIKKLKEKLFILYQNSWDWTLIDKAIEQE